MAGLNSLEVIERVATKIAPGRYPSFTEIQTIKALEMISTKENIGRQRLSKLLELSEGVTRTLLKHLKIEGLIETSTSGIALSRFGKEVLSDIRSRISDPIEIPESHITVGPSNTAILVRNVANATKSGLEQRDAAIKVGAMGATTLIFTHNKLTMLGVNQDAFKDIQQVYDILVMKLKPKENDVIIIGSANEKGYAELGAKVAALELLKNEKS